MITFPVPHYPWYAVVSGKDVEQGDILQGCPVYTPESVSHDGEAVLKRTRRDVIIMTHSCDMQRLKPPAVLFCDVIQRSAIPPDHNYLKAIISRWPERAKRLHSTCLPNVSTMDTGVRSAWSTSVKSIHCRSIS